MSKNKKITTRSVKKPNFEKEVMAKVRSGQVTMRPKWFFIAGSIFSLMGLISLSISALFLTNIIIFLLRKRGPMGLWRLEEALNSLPLWIPILAIIGIIGGIWFLKKYDFSYKKNFLLIIIGFILSIVISAWAIDSLGLNEILSKKGRMRRFYQQLELRDDNLPRNQKQIENGQGKFKNLHIQ